MSMEDVYAWCKEHKLRTIGESPRRHVIDTHFEPSFIELLSILGLRVTTIAVTTTTSTTADSGVQGRYCPPRQRHALRILVS